MTTWKSHMDIRRKDIASRAFSFFFYRNCIRPWTDFWLGHILVSDALLAFLMFYSLPNKTGRFFSHNSAFSMVPGASTSTKNTYGWCVEVDHHSTTDCFKICERYHRHVQPPPRNLCEHHQCVASFAFPSNNLAALKRINEQSRCSSTFYSLIGHGLVPLSKHTLWIATRHVCFLPVPSPASYWGLPIFQDYTGQYYLPPALISLLCLQYFYLFLRHWTLPQNLQTSVYTLNIQLKTILLIWTPIFLSKAL